MEGLLAAQLVLWIAVATGTARNAAPAAPWSEQWRQYRALIPRRKQQQGEGIENSGESEEDLLSGSQDQSLESDEDQFIERDPQEPDVDRESEPELERPNEGEQARGSNDNHPRGELGQDPKK